MVMTKVTVFKYVGQRSRPNHSAKDFGNVGTERLHHKDVHMKYKSPISNGSKVNIKVFTNKVKGHGQGNKNLDVIRKGFIR